MNANWQKPSELAQYLGVMGWGKVPGPHNIFHIKLGGGYTVSLDLGQFPAVASTIHNAARGLEGSYVFHLHMPGQQELLASEIERWAFVAEPARACWVS